jgi:hypothetical protein
MDIERFRWMSLGANGYRTALPIVPLSCHVGLRVSDAHLLGALTQLYNDALLEFDPAVTLCVSLLPASAEGLIQLHKASVFVAASGCERQLSRIE